MSLVTPHQLLQHMEDRAHPGIFILGSLERRVTLYSQQVRALNLAWSLFEQERIKPEDEVLVVGGGAAGLTFAAGAARLGANVTVLERSDEVLSTFQGNHTRWLHPHIYEWPRPGAEKPHAELPVMDWRAGIAGEVARELRAQWEELRERHRIQVHTQVRNIKHVRQSSGAAHTFTWHAHGFADGSFAAVVFAVGFGQERTLPSVESESYWRDDGQHQLFTPVRRFLISGTGDGGLVDLLRVRLRDFRHDKLVTEFLSGPELETTKKEILRIEAALDRNPLDDSRELTRRYRALALPDTFTQSLHERLRTDTRAVLNGREPYPLNKNACALNRFLTSCLMKMKVDGLEYRQGAITAKRTGNGYEVTIDDGITEPFDQVIVRHGPESSLTRDFPWLHEAANDLSRLNRLDQTRERLWSKDAFSEAPAPRSSIPSPPPSSAVVMRRGTLPEAVGLLGREKELEQLVAAVLAREPGSTAVLGPPGIGKSTVTIAMLHDPCVAEHFGTRRYFIRLDGARNAESMLMAIAQELALPPAAEPQQHVEATLGEAPALLVLDNAETPWHHEEQATEAMLRRLAAIPGLALVFSLRNNDQPHLPRSNTAVRVHPLPDHLAHRLFCTHARDVPPDHPLLPGLLAAQHGMPLAIILLAREAEGVDVDVTQERWTRERTNLLSRGSDRTSSVAVCVELSWSSPRLTSEARRLLSVLALLPSGAAKADRDGVFPLHEGANAAALLQKMALIYSEGARWRLLAPIREHVSHFHPPGPEDRERVRDFYFARARQLSSRVGHTDGGDALTRLAEDFPNVEALVSREVQAGNMSLALDLLVGTSNFLRFSGHGSLALMESVCKLAHERGHLEQRAASLKLVGEVSLRRSGHSRAKAAYTEALPLFEQLGDFYGQAHCVRGLASIALDQSQPDEAQQGFEKAIELYGRTGRKDTPRSQGNCVHGLAKVALDRGNLAEVIHCCERAHRLFEQSGHALGRAYCHRTLGDVAWSRTEREQARVHYEQAYRLFMETGEHRGAGHALRGMAMVDLASGAMETAGEQLGRSLGLLRQVGSIRGVANCHKALGEMSNRQSRTDEARSFYAQALAGFQQVQDNDSAAECQRKLAELVGRASP
jgi:tetratricopeptide (TPR) repeat protein